MIEGVFAPALRDAKTATSMYSTGAYLALNETWHTEDGPWKAQQVTGLLSRNGIVPRSIGDAGCGSGEVLKRLEADYPHAELRGFDISPQAIALARPRESERLSFILGGVDACPDRFDLMLALDVIEHVENPFAFLRALKHRANWKVFHIPLDMNCLGVMRGTPMAVRDSVGHLHCFSKETALATLSECGFQVVDWCYTLSAAAPGASRSWKARLLGMVRRTSGQVWPDFHARMIGGFSLLVLAR